MRMAQIVHKSMGIKDRVSINWAGDRVVPLVLADQYLAVVQGVVPFVLLYHMCRISDHNVVVRGRFADSVIGA